MKIAIPLDENKIDVCPVLARAYFFLFSENSKNEIVENPAASAPGGAGIQVAQFLVESDINVLITPRCGQNAADIFAEAETEIYKSTNQTAEENLESFNEGKLVKLDHFHGGFHGIQ